MRAQYVLHLPGHTAYERAGCELCQSGIRSRIACDDQLRGLDAELTRRLLLEPTVGLAREVHEPAVAGHQPDALHSRERLCHPAARRTGERHPLRHELLL